MSILLLSYPRSGNSWVRYFMEYITGQPSLGCRRARDKHDIPMYQKPENKKTLSHVHGSRNPISHKEHFVDKLKRSDYKCPCILLLRNYRECLYRQNFYGTNAKKFDKKIRNNIDHHAKSYYDIIKFYDDNKNKKLCIYYEDLILDYEKTFNKIFEFIECEDVKFNEFINNYKEHKNESLNSYKKSKTNGNDLLRYSNKMLPESITFMNSFMNDYDPLLYVKYLKRYQYV